MALQDYFDIGSALKKVRKENGYTQKAFAEYLGIPVTTFCGYEHNSREIPKALLEKILNDFGYTLLSFVGIYNLDIAQKAKKFRASNNLTLDEFAQITGVSRATLGRLEKGMDNPTIKTLRKIEVVLGNANNFTGCGGERC